MNNENNIGNWSGRYAIVKFIVKIAFYLFYRKIYVSGQENIPDGGRLIFAANHQNALMDALAIITTSKYQPVFLARADLFIKPLIARIMQFFKIMPVYRFKDGVDSMGQNEDTFEKTSKVLAAGGCIGIMPEGTHGEQKRLQELKKGVFRIAFRAEEAYNNSLNVKIVPVGLDYSNTQGIFEKLTVNFGEPLAVSGYFDLYSQHPQKGINAMKKDLAGSLKSLIVDIKDDAYYEQDKLLLDIGSQILIKRISRISGKTLENFTVERAYCQAMYNYFEQNPGKADELRSKSSKLSGLMKTYNISINSLINYKNPLSFFAILKSIFCFPFFIAGFFLHIVPYLIIKLALKGLKDAQFISSFKFVLGLLLIPLNYIFLALLFFSHFTPPLAALIIVSMPLAGFFAYSCYRQSLLYRDLMYFRRICRKNKTIAGLVSELDSKIIAGLEPVCYEAESKLK